MGKSLVVVIYDGVLNSVFHGQVLEPLVAKLNSGMYDHAYLVSFEKELPDKEELTLINNTHPSLSIAIFTRHSFLTAGFLFYQIRCLRKMLERLPTYDIIARGAIAGFLVLKAVKSTRCSRITIQARGLLGEEYRYEYQNVPWPLSLFYEWRAQQYEAIERTAYNNVLPIPCTIEAVSAALEEYIIRTFGANPSALTRANADVPQVMPQEQVKCWRTLMRAQLGLPEEVTVYCFSGAVKRWQEPKLVVDYFIKQYKKQMSSFLLVLTPNTDQFKQVLEQYIPSHSYYVTSVPYTKIYEYLAAADVGVVFREPGIVSWVSRPVKAMEYEAVGLSIVHNNTVDWLLQRYGTNRELMK